ncbi:MAG: hypothetical protein L3J74_12750 [Bacteroidales bacterium]|nr:hypothetical protein [Bacteroidales bacterium]
MKTILQNNKIKELSKREQKETNGGSNLGYLFGIYTVATLATMVPFYGNAYYSYELYKHLK